MLIGHLAMLDACTVIELDTTSMEDIHQRYLEAEANEREYPGTMDATYQLSSFPDGPRWIDYEGGSITIPNLPFKIQAFILAQPADPQVLDIIKRSVSREFGEIADAIKSKYSADWWSVDVADTENTVRFSFQWSPEMGWGLITDQRNCHICPSGNCVGVDGFLVSPCVMCQAIFSIFRFIVCVVLLAEQGELQEEVLVVEHEEEEVYWEHPGEKSMRRGTRNVSRVITRTVDMSQRVRIRSEEDEDEDENNDRPSPSPSYAELHEFWVNHYDPEQIDPNKRRQGEYTRRNGTHVVPKRERPYPKLKSGVVRRITRLTSSRYKAEAGGEDQQL